MAAGRRASLTGPRERQTLGPKTSGSRAPDGAPRVGWTTDDRVVRLIPGDRDRDDGSPRQRDRRAAAVRLVAELVVVGLLVVGAVALVAVDGTRVSHDLRELLMRLSPLRGVVVALVVGVVGALLLAWPRSRPRPARTAGPGQLPVVALLGLVVVAAATFRLLLGRAATEPRVFGDELVYSGLAKGFALEGQPLFRGAVDLAHSMLYPLLIAPAHVLGGDGARAFEATKAMNAVVVASAAVPAYLLARRVVTPLFALAVAFLVAFEPWTAYASLVMTESLFLPAFTTFVLLLARMLERPTLGRQLAVLGMPSRCSPGSARRASCSWAPSSARSRSTGSGRRRFRRTLSVYRPLARRSRGRSRCGGRRVRRSARTLPARSPAASSRVSSIRWGS